ncbi:MAG TPA: hypothetical protein PLZ51_19880, partial [Aggregatilineales bacterium]|nr:hypothetical protein [Aggregatilineales bacterium]
DRPGSLYMWDYEGDIYTTYEFSQPFYQFDFFTNSQQIAYLPYSFETLSEIIIADIETSEIHNTLQHPADITGFQLSQDNHTLVVRLQDETLWLWDTDTWTVRMVLNGYFVEFMPNSQLMWVVNNHSFILLDIYTGEIVQTISIFENYHTKYSPDGRLVVYLSTDNRFYITDIKMEVVSDIYRIYNLQTPDDGIMRLPSVQFSPDERFIMISGRGIILIYAIMNTDMA